MDPEMETILHPSPSRFKVLGLFTFVGQLLFWYVWAVMLPQPYENIFARLFIASLGIGLFFMQSKHGQATPWVRKYFSCLFWLQLPVFFTWMYWMNNGSAVWLVSMAAMILIYYQITDWRLASLGLISGVGVATLLAATQFGVPVRISTANSVALVFCFFAAIALAASSANLRRERIKHSLAVIGIMAHELRTPLATASLIGQAIRAEIDTKDEAGRAKRLDKLATGLESLTRTINHHIDLQMINARLMQLPQVDQRVSAAALVNAVVQGYPYGSPREQQCVEIIVHQDFCFLGSERQFTQVLNNLMKNALYSLKAAQSRFSVGDVRIELGVKSGIGKITLSDQGLGISADHLARIFEPFFSTSDETGHGLGLAYCRQVVQNAGGFIRVKAEPAFGAIFTIDLPALSVTPPSSQAHAIPSLPPS
jgi:two-component system, CAI-1 autoinducer sensor kinase/phosphatase CqsS